VTTTVPGGSSYKFQIQGTFGSGSAEEEESHKKEVAKKNHFLSKMPVPSKKGKVVETFESKNKFPNHPYVKPEEFKPEPKPFESSGDVTGTYSYQNAPWPSTWSVFINLNLQLSTDILIYNFEIAADPSTVDPSEYTGYFNVSDFKSLGQITRHDVNTTYSLAPNMTNYFNATLG
jgi:hypothetical protein